MDARPAADPGPRWRDRFADLESVLGRSLSTPSEFGAGRHHSHGAPSEVVNGYGQFDGAPRPSQTPPAGPEAWNDEASRDPYRTADYDGRCDVDQAPPAAHADNPYYAYADDGNPAFSHDGNVGGRQDSQYNEPVRDRRSLPRVVLAVLGLVVVGSVAAYGYRSWRGPASSVPPIIKASTEPAKIMADGQGADSQGGKQIYDRLDNAHGQVQGENIVPRQEEPIALPTQPPGPPAATLPAASPAIASSVNILPAVIAPPPLIGGIPANRETKKVHTVAIRPDQPSSSAPASQADAVPQAVPYYPSAIASVPDYPPAIASVPAGTSVWPAASPPATAVATPRTPTRARKPKPGTNEPMAIGPQAEAFDAGKQSATTPVMRSASAPTQTAALPAAAEAGHYVQVSSQRSEAEARASFRALQQKYPGILGSRELVVRRVDLGAKGVYYRAQIGPLATLEDANRLCGALKAAGGQCIIQHN